MSSITEISCKELLTVLIGLVTRSVGRSEGRMNYDVLHIVSPD